MPVGSRKNGAPIAEINITPLVDVMLVILIIFMVMAPTMQHGIKVDVPEATLTPIQVPEMQVVVSITKDKKIHISYKNTDREADLDTFQDILNKIFARNPNKEVLLRADKRVPYGTVMETLAAIKAIGIYKIGMITEPEE